jgi:cell division protein FtsL
MNPALQTATPQTSNPIQAAKLVKFVALAFLLGAIGLAYVFVKNQQFVLAEQIRKTERQIRDVQSRNEVLIARVTELSSRPMLQKRVSEKFIAVVAITGDKIARLTPPATAVAGGVMRTAFNSESAQ